LRAQFTLTVPEAKRLIARAVAALPEVRSAMAAGRVLLKGGTTVSAVAEELVGTALRICGRISPRGTLTQAEDVVGPHSVLVAGGEVRGIDADIVEVARSLGPADVVIIGANALDVHGTAAMMAGSASGGLPGEAMSGFLAEGARVVIPVGLEKLIPGSISHAVAAAGRKSVDFSLGMGVGLIPIHGRVVTEQHAAEILAHVEATVIGRGGIMGAEGATVMAVEGERDEVERLFALVRSIKGAVLSGIAESLEECRGATPRCRDHLACVYRREKSR
jgi:hypothetical protein